MVAASADNSAYDGLILFGGVNLNSYCRSKIFTFQFGQIKNPKSSARRDTVDAERDPLGQYGNQTLSEKEDNLFSPKSESTKKSVFKSDSSPMTMMQVMQQSSKQISRRHTLLQDMVKERIDICRDICNNPNGQ
jgi:hypothetical protein